LLWDAMRKIIRSKQAVSEVIGVVLLLGMAVMLFTILNFNVFSFSFGSSNPNVNLIGTIDKTNNVIFIEHNGGTSLELTTVVIITIDSDNYQRKAGDGLIDKNHDNEWNFGEILKFNFNEIDLMGKYIKVMVVDPVTNTMVLSVVL
jgi:hypothetical protein